MATLERKRIVPPIGEGRFAFSILAPADWQQPAIPEETPDFSEPHAMKGFAVFVSNNPTVPMLLTVSGRPGYEDGAVMQWARFIIEKQGFAIQTCMPVRLESHEAIEITCTQEADPVIGQMMIKGIFVEDGGSFFVVTTMAPTRLFGELEADFAVMRNSFALEQVRGPTKPLVEGGPIPEAIQKSAAGSAGETTEPDFRKYVRDDPTALDEADAINSRFRDAGAGLVVRVQRTEPGLGYAVVGSGALVALFAVPLGWHVVDDGRRTLIFDKNNDSQINLNRIGIDGRSPDAIFTEIVQELAVESPNVEHQVLDLGGNPAIAVRNLVINGEALMQCYILLRHPHEDNVAIKVRVTAAEATIGKTLDMTGDIVKTIQYMK